MEQDPRKTEKQENEKDRNSKTDVRPTPNQPGGTNAPDGYTKSGDKR